MCKLTANNVTTEPTTNYLVNTLKLHALSDIYIHIYALHFSVHEADKGCSVPHTQQGRKLWRSPVNANKGKRLLSALRKANVEIKKTKKTLEMIFPKIANVLQLATNLIREPRVKRETQARNPMESSTLCCLWREEKYDEAQLTLLILDATGLQQGIYFIKGYFEHWEIVVWLLFGTFEWSNLCWTCVSFAWYLWHFDICCPTSHLLLGVLYLMCLFNVFIFNMFI